MSTSATQSHGDARERDHQAPSGTVVIGPGCTEWTPEEAAGHLDDLVSRAAAPVVLAGGSEASAWPHTFGTTAWWEHALLTRGYAKSPAPAEGVNRLRLQADGTLVRHAVRFDALPRPVLDRYPLEALRAERDLHMDMLREAGPRSDAHLARYRWACSRVPAGGTVADAACGLAYGSAILAAGTGAQRVVGIDASAYAIDYGRAVWAADARVALELGDVRALPFADATIDVFVSFETLEHLDDDEPFLAEIQRVLVPGGRLLGSVPNLWVDGTGRDPSPYHFQVFDAARLRAVLEERFAMQALWQQNAAFDADGTQVPPRLHRIALDGSGSAGKPEWLLFEATKR